MFVSSSFELETSKCAVASGIAVRVHSNMTSGGKSAQVIHWQLATTRLSSSAVSSCIAESAETSDRQIAVTIKCLLDSRLHVIQTHLNGLCLRRVFKERRNCLEQW
jgi:hypothetical protein